MTNDTPMCDEGHGYMVPMHYELCFAPRDGVVTAVVEWVHEDGGIKAKGYALSDEAWAELPKGEFMGNDINRMLEDGRLVSVYDLLGSGNRYMRIDDNRPGYNHGYMLWISEERREGVGLIPGTVYHYYGDEDEPHTHPRLTRFEEVVELMCEPSSLLITQIPHSLAHEPLDVPEAMEQWGSFDGRVVVWDRSAIVQNRQN